MSPDEGASWAAAAAPTAHEVITRQPLLNPGELPIHDLMLHEWIALFGSSLTAMRALSAALGVASILLVYFCVCELFVEAPLTRDDASTVGSLSAIVFAVNLVTIKYSHEARMYPLMLAAILAQVTMFLRTLRIGGLANYLAVVLLTAIAIASNFAALLIPATEGLWLIYIIARAGLRPGNLKVRRTLMLAYSLAGGGMILVPRLFSSLHAASAGDIGGWRKLPALVRAFRAIQQSHRQLRISNSRTARDLGRRSRMESRRARLDRLRAALDVGAASHDAHRVVRNRARVRRALRTLIASFRFSSSSQWESSKCPAIFSAPPRSHSQSHSPSATSSLTIANRTTRNIAKQSPPPIPPSSRAKS